MTDNLRRDLLFSAAGHLIIAAIIFLKAVLLPSEPLDLRQAIRVDVVGLPEKIKEPDMSPKSTPAEPKPKPLPPKEAAKPKVKDVPKVPDLKAKKKDLQKSQKEALNAIKSLQALDKIKKDVSDEKKQDKAANEVKGNRVAEGNSPTGLEKIEFDRYLGDLENKIRGNWSIPQWLADARLTARVQILIDERGYVVKKIFKKSSGNDIFDNSVVAAIDNSSPLGEPPKRLRGLLSTGGVVLNFPE
ncbi:MAG: energy transducer TonB [Bdellovibrionales bacterium]